MENFINALNKLIEKFLVEVETVDADNIQAMGSLMNSMDELVQLAQDNNQADLIRIGSGIKSMAGSLAWGEPDHSVEQVQDGAKLLKELSSDIESGAAITDKVTDYLNKCGVKETTEKSEEIVEEEEPEAEEIEEPEPENQFVVDLSQDKELIENFIMEALENFRDIEVSIVELEEDPGNIEIINDIFRPFHTIKGVSGFLNLTQINKLTHQVETLLDEARDQRLVIDENIIDLVLAAIDLTKNMINHLDEQLKTGDSTPKKFGMASLIKRLKNAAEGKFDEAPSKSVSAPKSDLKPSDIIPLDDDSDEEIEDEDGDTDSDDDDIPQKSEAKDTPVKQEPPTSSPVAQAAPKKAAIQSPAFVKVDTHKLDNMIDMVGELVINQAMLNQEIGDSVSSDNRKLYSSITQLTRITSEIQRISMSMRMIPIKQTFQKMVRLVRDLAKKSGKQIGLKMLGEETEIDRNMVDEIYDPLVHLVRNSCDHGLELPEDRRKKGKAEKGLVTLNAYHKGGNIVIEIKDDGRGLNRDKIIKKALEKNLIKTGENLADLEVFSLIFQPGFSTADKITDVSGRGVGMDVVKRVIDNMRGKLEVVSEPDQGTVIFLKLPLTLAIIDGIIVRAGERDYIMPTASVLESLRPERESYKHVVNKGEMIQIRERLYPLIRLHEIFGFEPKNFNPWEGIVVVAESDGRHKCILVDEIVGKQEVVIKNLGGLKKVKGMAGGAILADGRVGLILDVSGLFEISEN
ncbi:MAG: chemotaxis protein CheA [Candidatus Magnetomorum sp.]|nr:chemotaxis protein CheA [Candidatus Magnetomorum sp.]